ncbi:hypothetical protein ACJMK2_026627 [Sinanodonta woodiana]|uniref:Uncharacterized protein n=1 Tax=Sinanodonta woodiana TaxID=1069815 RepID=A0ABD3XKN0_SINWO
MTEIAKFHIYLVCSVETLTTPDIAFEDISDSSECIFYTGIPDSNTIRLVVETLNDAGVYTQRNEDGNNSGPTHILRPMDEFILVLIGLRLGLLLQDLA